MRKILIILCAMFIGTAYACESNEIDILGDGTQCETAKFSLTTTNLAANDVFKFNMSATGTFYVDCGADGVLSGTGADGTKITRTNTTPATYTCTYATAGEKNLQFGGVATGYSTNQKIAAISFGYYDYTDVGVASSTYRLVKSISGSLGAIFPTLTQSENGTSVSPKFICTFNQTKINSIPTNLFSGVRGGTYKMFDSTFARTMITSIPENLFAGITGSGDVFFSTFLGCTRLTSIPSGLFKDATRVTIYGFYYTFYGCTGLTSIPAGLFSSITTGASHMFTGTFYGCTGLTSIPADLFSSITTAAESMFSITFQDCTNLSGYIPPSTFAGLIANGSPTATYMWNGTFSGTKLVKSCPAGTTQYITGYEGTNTTNYTKWNGYVSCVDENLVCGAGEYLPAHWYQCEMCPENNYCVGGTYPYSETITSGITQCASGLYSPAGMWESAQCGRILHIGDNVVYLRSTKKTSPALHIDIDNDGVADYFGNMTTLDVVMNANTDKKLKLQYGGQTYSVYDDTVNVGE